MKKRIGILHFSSTGTTEKICKKIVTGMGEGKPQILNMTSPETRKNIIADSAAVTDKIDHLIVGAPVHSGKIPVQVIECLKALNGNGKECSAIVVYGNRDYGIALHVMVSLLSEAGFKIASAAAFIGQHTYSNIVPVAIGRPDGSDMKVARLFGFMSLNVTGILSPDDIPIQLEKVIGKCFFVIKQNSPHSSDVGIRQAKLRSKMRLLGMSKVGCF